MRYIPCWKQIGIEKDRYLELLHFCRQYPEWQMEAASLIGIQGMKIDGQPRGTKKHDPVAAAAERREQLMRKIGIVDSCARDVGNGEWYTAIIQNVCMKKPYSQIDVNLMPTSDRNTFFKRRREFFSLINEKKPE
jgi:hypothetical protein